MGKRDKTKVHAPTIDTNPHNVIAYNIKVGWNVAMGTPVWVLECGNMINLRIDGTQLAHLPMHERLLELAPEITQLTKDQLMTLNPKLDVVFMWDFDSFGKSYRKVIELNHRPQTPVEEDRRQRQLIIGRGKQYAESLKLNVNRRDVSEIFSKYISRPETIDDYEEALRLVKRDLSAIKTQSEDTAVTDNMDAVDEMPGSPLLDTFYEGVPEGYLPFSPPPETPELTEAIGRGKDNHPLQAPTFHIELGKYRKKYRQSATMNTKEWDDYRHGVFGVSSFTELDLTPEAVIGSVAAALERDFGTDVKPANSENAPRTNEKAPSLKQGSSTLLDTVSTQGAKQNESGTGKEKSNPQMPTNIVKLDESQIRSKYTKKLQGGKEYLEVAGRVLLFRLDHPAESGWTIDTDLALVNDDGCVFKAKIVDPDGRTIATGHGRAIEAKSTTFSGRIFEKAETAAIGRALAHAGYGTDDVEEADDSESPAHYADSPRAANKAS